MIVRKAASALLALLAALAPGCGGRDADAAPAGDPRQRDGGLAAERDDDDAAPRGERAVTHLRIEGALDVGALGLVRRAAEETRGVRQALLIEIDTPGGEIELMWKLARAIDDASRSGLHTIAWVNTHAMSAGALVAMACDRLYMRGAATIGSAYPVRPGPAGLAPVADDPAVREKILASLRAEFRAWAEEHGRNPTIAEAMVDPDVEVRRVRVDNEPRIVSGAEWQDLQIRGGDVVHEAYLCQVGEILILTGEQARDWGIANAVAETIEAVLDKEGLSGARIVTMQRTRSEDLASFLDSIKVLLLLIGLVAAYIEFKVPGFGAPGIVSIVAFALFLFGQYLVGLADVPHVVAVGLGLAFVALEIFVMPGAIWPGVLGGLLVVGGLVLAMLGPGATLEYGLDRQVLSSAVLRFFLAIAGAVVGGALVSRFLPRTPVLRHLVLAGGDGDMHAAAMQEAGGARATAARPGALGRALTDLRPVGKVALDGEGSLDWEARSPTGAIDAGARVRVVEVAGGRLVVEAVEAIPDEEARS